VPAQRGFAQSSNTTPVPAPLRSFLRKPLSSIHSLLAGPVWRPPYELEVTPWLQPGANTCQIVVGNLAINLMAGKSLPGDRLLDSRYGKRFSPQDMNDLQPLPPGLLGPITLLAR